MSQILKSEGIEIARQIALLGAESALKTPPEIVVAAERGWPVEIERWQSLGKRMRSHEMENPPTRAVLLEKLGLRRFDYWLLCFLLAAEVYPDAAAALSIVAEDERIYLPTPLSFARLMQAALGEEFMVAFQSAIEGGHLGELGLVVSVETIPGRPISHRGLRIAANELEAILSDRSLVGLPLGLALQWMSPAEAPIFQPTLIEGATRLLREHQVIWMRASSARIGRQFALDMATAIQEKIAYLKLSQTLPKTSDLARVRDGLLTIDLFNLEDGGPPFGWLEQVHQIIPQLLIVAPQGFETGNFPAITVPKLDLRAVKRVWDRVPLNSAAKAALSSRFQITLIELRAALREVEHTRLLSGNAHESASHSYTETAITQAVLTQGARSMGKIVTHIDSGAHLDQLVVPIRLKEKLVDIINWRKVSAQVYDQMKVKSSSHLSRGLTCLFSGPPGTGKTFAAQCVANALGLNLYRVDLSQVVSKYIGETEKSLAQIFDEVEAGHGILLFDEADALFGKRSEVKDAHDRYANIEVGYLLQRIETFDGTLILATNLRNNIDLAFLRRIQFLLDFPMPDRHMRQQLWQQSLPAASFLDESLDVTPFCEQFRLSGGSIRNIAIAAAHLAAVTETGCITPAHLARATYRELEKNGQSRTKNDFGSIAKFLSEDTWATASR